MVTPQQPPSDHAVQTLDLLFSRLSWPSALVAERACTALGGLLVHPTHAAETEEALFKWLGEQKLETVACHGLLAVKQAQIRGGGLRRSMLERLTAAVLPSFLSWLLLVELADRALPPPDWTTAFSGPAPVDHEIDPSFLKSMGKFPPVLYRDWAGHIQRRENIPFVRQWDFEKQRILDRFTIKPSEESLSFRRTGSEPRHAILDLPLGEVHRSAFLRALAWAHHEHGLHRDHCVFFAASLCPLDFGLWRVRPAARPDWWPAPVAVESPLDVAPAAIWSKLETDLVPIDQGNPHEWILTQAQGPIRVGAATYDLSVWGIFQRCVGPEVPEPEVLADWCDSLERLPWEGPSMHAMEGQVSARPPDDGTQSFADWQVAPAAFPIHAQKLLRWQWWQLSRPAWLPSPLLCRGAIHFKNTASGLEATSDARTIGRGTTWTDGLAETLDPPIPPASGQALHTRRDVLTRYARDGDWTFCWVCRLTAYLRNEKYESYREAHFYKVFGASAVLKP